MPAPAVSVTRSAYLELRGERELVQEGYEFLDEKRILLASRMLSLLERYDILMRRYRELHVQAVAALAGAIGRHGLDGVSVYPGLDLSPAVLSVRREKFIGIELLASELPLGETAPTGDPVMPSREARHCMAIYRALLELAPELAAVECNLRRLEAEFVRTERRARALENVLIPEIDTRLKQIDEQLEVLQLEEGLRTRHAAERGGGRSSFSAE